MDNILKTSLCEHTLDLLKLRSSRYVTNSILREARFNVREILAEDMVECVLQLIIPGRTVVSSKILVPISWWDHFKHDHPKLCSIFSSPNYKEHEVSLTAVCPHVDIPWNKDHGPHIRFIEGVNG